MKKILLALTIAIVLLMSSMGIADTRKTVFDGLEETYYLHKPSHVIVNKGGREIFFRVIRQGQAHTKTGDKGNIVMFVSTDGGYTDSGPITIYDDPKWDYRAPGISYDAANDKLIVMVNQIDQNVSPIKNSTNVIILSVTLNDFLGDISTVWTKRTFASGFTDWCEYVGTMVVYSHSGTDYWGIPVYGRDIGDPAGDFTATWFYSTDQFATAPSSSSMWASTTDLTETFVAMLSNGVLHGLIRADTAGAIKYIQSSDGGGTWGAVADHSPVFRGGGEPYFAQLSNGSLVTAYRGDPSEQVTFYKVSDTADSTSWGAEGIISNAVGAASNISLYCQPIIDSNENIHFFGAEEVGTKEYTNAFLRIATESSQVLTFIDIEPTYDKQATTIEVPLVDVSSLAANINTSASSITERDIVLVVNSEVATGAASDYPVTMTSDTTGNAEVHYRHIIPASALSGTGDRARIQIERAVGGDMFLQNIVIGHKAAAGNPYDFADGFKLFTFNGKPRVFNTELFPDVNADSKFIWSDWIPFEFDGTTDLIIATSFARNPGFDDSRKKVDMPAGYIEYSIVGSDQTYYGGAQTPPGVFSGPTAGRALFVTDIEFEDDPATTELDGGWYTFGATGTIDWSTFSVLFDGADRFNPDLASQAVTSGFHLTGFKVYINGSATPVWGTDTWEPIWTIMDLTDSAITDATNAIRIKTQLNGAEGFRPQVGAFASVGLSSVTPGGGGGTPFACPAWPWNNKCR